MKKQTFRLFLFAVLAVSLLTSLPFEAIAKHKGKGHGGGPPDWAPAHGYRRKFTYYPKQRVYYDAQRKQYLWLDAGVVKIGTKLPSSIKISGSGVSVELPKEKPDLIDFRNK